MARRILGPAVVAALIANSCFAQKIEVMSRDLDVTLAAESLVRIRFANGQAPAGKRQRAMEHLFTDAGCMAKAEPVGPLTFQGRPIDRHSGNVVCTLPGRTDSTIAAGGHFDFADEGEGIVDDWSGASLLPSLYQALKNQPRSHTYVFIAFTGEEEGLLGSTRYVKNLTANQKSRTRAFVNLECLGLNPVKVWYSRSTPALMHDLAEVAATIGASIQGINFENADDDTHPFLGAHIPAICVHSLTPDTIKIIHSPDDKMDAIHFDEYYKAYKLAAYYLAYLDVKTD